MSVKVIGTNVRKVYHEVCGNCLVMLEYGRADIQHKDVGCTCGEAGCDRDFTWSYVVCPGCKHEVPHDESNPAKTIFFPQ